jgi:hypothetical protein
LLRGLIDFPNTIHYNAHAFPRQEQVNNIFKEVLMRKFGTAILLLALGLSLHAAEVKVNIRKMAEGTGNMRNPMIGENARGERLYTYRGSDAYAHFLYYKNGTWTGGGRIPGSPQFDDYWYSDIVADSTGTFHYVVEEADHFLYYAYFQNGAWSSLRKLETKHEATLALGVRSDDTLVLVNPIITRNPKGVTKDILVATKTKNQTTFTGWKNVTNDYEPSTMVDVAIDAQDNTWISYKGVFFKGAGETMQATLLGLDKNNKEILSKNVSGQDEPAWCWYPRLAINSDGKIMVSWMLSQAQTYFYRLYDPATKKWGEVKAITGGPIRPWPHMYNKLLARGQDFYWIGMNSGRLVSLYKYDAEKDKWDKLADVSQGGAMWFSACNAADSILISWESQTSPTVCYLTEVTASFAPIIRLQSVSNLVVEKKVERGFFHGYSLNSLTWEANPLNAEQNITITAQRVYRKARTAESSEWARIAELGAGVYSYDDRNVPADSDYVYAVTCVDDKGAESPIIDPSPTTTGATNAPKTTSRAVRIDH